MSFPEVVLIIVAVLFVGYTFGKMIYKRVKGMPSDECSSCKSNMTRMLKKAKKEAKKFNTK